MKAAKLYGKDDFRLVETEIPVINEEEMLLEVKCAAICGTDLRMIANGAKGIDIDNPKILGHELSGKIIQVGKNVHGYHIGERVAIAPNVGCGVCDMCVNGNSHLCECYQAFGINMDGAFAQFVRVPANVIRQGNVMKIPEFISYEEAALFEPLSCVMNGQDQADVKLGESILIIGAGPIGLMHAIVAKARGASRIFMNDLSHERLEQCQNLFDAIEIISDGNLKEEIMNRTANQGVDVVIVACPSPQAQENSLELLKLFGRALFFGGLPKEKENISINSNLIHYKQIKICGSTRSSLKQYRLCSNLVEGKSIEIEKLISKSYKLDDILEAIEYAKSAKGIKTVIKF